MDITTWMNNHTEWTDFILVGLFSQSQHPSLLCVAIFLVFLMALSGNALLILLIHSNVQLHTPMYFFISQLSLVDMMYISITVPKVLLDQILDVSTISVPECGIQMFLYVTLGGSEHFLLAAMAYDRYMAICHPLRYPMLMNYRVCLLLVSGCWFLGSVDGFMLTSITMTFPFCKSRKIHHFFCEVPAVMKLSSDTSLYETLMYLCCVLMLLIPVTVISVSYSCILLTIHRMNSAEGRRKALATCSSHMMVVMLFYGAAVYNYMLPSSYHTPQKDMVVSVFYTILTPVLNPLIYSFRNKDVTGALRKMLSVGPFFRETIK
ncbi:olfactory receptor 2T29-like [Urocitellus parryii]